LRRHLRGDRPGPLPPDRLRARDHPRDARGLCPGVRDLWRGVREPRGAPRALPPVRRGMSCVRARVPRVAGRRRLTTWHTEASATKETSWSPPWPPTSPSTSTTVL